MSISMGPFVALIPRLCACGRQGHQRNPSECSGYQSNRRRWIGVRAIGVIGGAYLILLNPGPGISVPLIRTTTRVVVQLSFINGPSLPSRSRKQRKSKNRSLSASRFPLPPWPTQDPTQKKNKKKRKIILRVTQFNSALGRGTDGCPVPPNSHRADPCFKMTMQIALRLRC